MRHLTPAEEAFYEQVAKTSISKHPGRYIAPLLLGGLFDFILFGLMIAQLWRYASTASRDRMYNKVIVGISGVLAIGTTIFTIVYMLHIFAFNFGTYLPMVSWEYLNWYALLNVLTTNTVSAFYAERTYVLYRRSKWVLVAVVPFMLASLAGGFGFKIVAGSQLTNSTEVAALRPYLTLWLISELVLGLLLTGLIMYRLIKSKTGWSDTDWVINRLVFVSMEGQLPATLVSLGFLISFGIKENSAVNVFFELFHPKVYVVGMLVVLNSRGGLRRALHPGGSVPSRPAIFKSEVSGFRVTQCPTEAETVDGDGQLQVQMHPDRATALPNLSFDNGQNHYSQWSTSDAETAVGSPMVMSPSFRTIKEKEGEREHEGV